MNVVKLVVADTKEIDWNHAALGSPYNGDRLLSIRACDQELMDGVDELS